MRKILALLFVLIVAISGCTKDELDVNQETNSAQQTEKATSTPTAEPTPTEEPTAMPTATPTSAISEVPEVELVEYVEDVGARVNIGYTQIIDDISINLVVMKIEKQPEFYGSEEINYVHLLFEVKNLSDTKTIRVNLDSSILMLNTGETGMPIYFEGYQMELKPNDVIQEVYDYKIRSTRLSEINSFKLLISPSTINGELISDKEFEFNVDFQLPVYEEVTREELINRLYTYWYEAISGFDKLGRIHKNDFVKESGPIILHVPVAATIIGYEYTEDVKQDLLELPFIIEFDSTQGFYHIPTHSAAIIGENSAECNPMLSEIMPGYHIGAGFTTGIMTYDVTGLNIQDEEFLGFACESPQKDGEYIGDKIVDIINLE